MSTPKDPRIERLPLWAQVRLKTLQAEVDRVRDWQRITDAPPPSGEKVLLYFPAEPRMVLSAFIAAEYYPPPFPRKPTLWCKIPLLPQGLR